MSELVKQAGENDNISVLYVVDENEHFYGAIDLKDLIIARAEDPLAELIVGSYPYVTDREKISDCIERIVDYAERSLPVLNVVLFLPYTVQYVTSSFTQISDSLMAAGQVFGGSPVYILRRITLPLIRQGIATGWMMTFIIAFRELVTASLIAPPNTLVVSTFIVREFEQGSVSVGMAMAVLCVLFSTTALLILNTVIDHRKVH